MSEGIDFVVTWVDGADPVWRRDKQQYSGEINDTADARAERFREWDMLKYWFRGVEKFAPWVRKIHFITWGHVPEFLDVNHPKLNIVKHTDYIPEEYLPTYNSGTIEMNVHRIEDLSENYIMFNDDFFPLRPIDENYYFKNNIVCDEAVENIIVAAEFGAVGNAARYMQVNNMIIINRHFKKREVQKKHWDKWYCEDYGELLERTKSLSYWNDFPGIHKGIRLTVSKSFIEIFLKTKHMIFLPLSSFFQYLRFFCICYNFTTISTKTQALFAFIFSIFYVSIDWAAPFDVYYQHSFL